MTDTTKKPAGEFACPCNHIRRDSSLTTTARLVGWSLWSFADAATDEAHPKISTIMRDLGLPRRTVERALHDLRKAGWIERVKNTGRYVRYRMIWSRKRNGAPECAKDGAPECATGGVPIEQNQEQNQEEKKRVIENRVLSLDSTSARDRSERPTPSEPTLTLAEEKQDAPETPEPTIVRPSRETPVM